MFLAALDSKRHGDHQVLVLRWILAALVGLQFLVDQEAEFQEVAALGQQALLEAAGAGQTLAPQQVIMVALVGMALFVFGSLHNDWNDGSNDSRTS